MTLPIDLVLVRHGESEGNVATRFSKNGDNRYFTPEFLARHSSSFRLSPEGRRQAAAAGAWIRTNLYGSSGKKGFGRYLTSEYTRAMETAALLGLPRAEWYVSFYLRERVWGDMEVLPEDMRRERFTASMEMKHEDPFHWKPPNGESIADVCLRVDRVLQTLHREANDKRVIIVCHGEIMWAFRILLERMTQERFKELDLSKHPHDRIHNCHVLHYTRSNPDICDVAPYASWVRSTCPWDLSRSSNEWQEIKRPHFTSEELRLRVAKTPSMIE